MALVVKDRVKETTTTTGTGTYTLAGASTGFQSFSVIGNGNTTYYTVTDNVNWEVGIGTYTSSGTTLSRDTILASSNSGNAVNWGAGTKDVFVTYPAERSVSGPASATDNAVVRFDTTDGTIIQNSGVTIDDSNNMTGVVALTATGNINFDGGTFVFNDSGADKDFRVEGDTDANLLFTDASTDRVGIGTSTPGVKLDVVGAGVFKVDGSGSTTPLILRNNNTVSTQLVKLGFDSNGAIKASINAAVYGDDYMTFNVGSDTERMRITAGGDVGIGTSSPSTYGDLAVYRAKTGVAAISVTQQNAATNDGAKLSTYYQTTETASLKYYWDGSQFQGQLYSYGPLAFLNGASPTERMRIDSSGNVGIGATPSAWSGAVPRALQFGSNAAVNAGAALYLTCNGFYNGTNWIYQNTDLASYYIQNVGNHQWFSAASGTAGNTISFSERARITSGGDFLVNATATSSYFDGKLNVAGRIHAKSNEGAAKLYIVWNTATTGDNGFIDFGTEGTFTGRGSIDYNRAGGLTRYNTTSDYRAKDILGSVANPGATIDALKVYEGRMKGATQSRPMLVAHEAQEHAPYAVSGVKDEVNEDGTPKFQQMDVSSLVPLLIAEIQSLRARVAALESKGA